jgi:glycosyltransferase involved in cell wall biosynthesis
VKVIVVASNVSARFGGEAILPLHYFRLLRRRGIEAWLVAHERTKEELLEALPNQSGRMHFVPDLRSQKWLHKLSRPLPKRVSEISLGWGIHILTAVMQVKIVRQLVAEHGVNVVHEPVPVSPRQPSIMRRVGAPVVIGPMNGGMTYPPAFHRYQGNIERSLVLLGRSASGVLNRILPGKREAEILLVANQRTHQALPQGVAHNVLELVENGVDLGLFQRTAPVPRRSEGRMRFVFVGALIDWKGVHLLLEAAARALKECDLELHIVGDGRMRSALERQACVLNLNERVVFHGFVAQTECPGILASCDALVLPSLYECGGAVVLEAMAMGLPVIATKWGGPADYLDETSGILVEPQGRDSFVEGIAEAMVRLAGSDELRRRLGESGRRAIVESFDWNRKIDQILEIYHSAVQHYHARTAGQPTVNECLESGTELPS